MTQLLSVPLATLSLSRHNIRRTASSNDIEKIEQLAASILAEGLLQNLNVAKIPPDVDQPAERYEVLAGGRRLRALQLLQERGLLPASLDQVPVNVVAPELANEVGLAENTVRERMHPHDEVVAFRDLAAAGSGVDTIANRFGVAAAHVKRVLKLANVSPELLRLFREDKLSVEQMQAFALVDDHKQQQRVYEAASRQGEWMLRPDQIRRTLTQKIIPTDDPRVVFVGLDHYLNQGGAMLADLFDPAEGGYIQNPKLLDDLVEQRWQVLEYELKQEGWSFVHVDRTPGGADFRHRCGRIDPKEVDGKEVWTDAQKAKAGAALVKDHQGRPIVDRGLVRAQAAKKAAKASSSGDKGKPEPAQISQAMVQRLSAHRQVALQATLFKRSSIALAALAHALLEDLFYPRGYDNTATIEVKATDQLEPLGKLGFADIDTSPALVGLKDAIAGLRQQLGVPTRKAQLFPWLLLQKPEAIHALLATAAVMSVNTVQRFPGEKAAGELLAQTLELDMAEHWRPTASNFFGLVPRSIAVEAVREVHGAGQAERVAGMKKDEAAGECERLLANSGWLPKPLRRPGYALAKPGAPTHEPAPAKAKAKPSRPAAKKPAAKKAVAKKSPPKKSAAKKHK